MPSRYNPFFEGKIYHIFNKTVDKLRPFVESHLNELFIEILCYYRSVNIRTKFSRYRQLANKARLKINQNISLSDNFRVTVMAYCLMPNHFHLLIRQNYQNGISRYMADVINSFTRYLNIRNSRKGPLFLTQFKAVEVTTDEHLKHISRYIHLNPYSSHIVKSKNDLIHYSFSSFRSYISEKPDVLIQNDKVMELFNFEKERCKKFVLMNADYQEQLEYLKHTYQWK